MKNTDKTNNEPGKISKLIRELQSLDVENYGNWSKPIQVTSWAITGVAAAVIGFFVLSAPLIEMTDTEQSNRDAKLAEYQEKSSKLKGAKQYQHQLVEIEQKFLEQLQQLPKESEIPGLVDDLNRAGKQAGLQIDLLKLQDEISKEFFIEQPIEITAIGDFHSFGKFLALVSALPRIVTVQTFSAYDTATKDGVQTSTPKVQYVIKASTYRYLDRQDGAATGKAAARK